MHPGNETGLGLVFRPSGFNRRFSRIFNVGVNAAAMPSTPR